MTGRSIATAEPHTTAPSSSTALGCYGLRLDGLDAGRLLLAAPDDWAPVHVTQATTARPAPELDSIGPHRAAVVLQTGGWVDLERRAATITFHLPQRRSDDEIVHPYLAAGASIAARWRGLESFHASAVVVGGGAWAVLGDKGDGKSSTVAWLTLHGHPVLTDDLLVVDGMDALAGPRCLDLRPDAARRLEAGEPLGVVGARERWRLPLMGVAPRVPMRGWLALGWAEAVEVVPVPPAERLLMLAAARSLRVPPQRPEVLVELSRLPAWHLRRPRDWNAMPAAAARFVELASG